MSDKQTNIIIGERGWVYVGLVYRDGDDLVITECYNIRRWDAAAGLGELALNGPGSSLLNFFGTVRIHVLAHCGRIECNEDVWEAYRRRRSRS